MIFGDLLTIHYEGQ